jgi:tetratricopeptide (TPR) repeat protein
MRLGELAESRQLHDESLLLKQELGNRRSISISLINLGEVNSLLGEVDAARRAFHEALRLTMAIQAYPLALDALVGLASLLQDEQPKQAIRLLRLAYHHPTSGRETEEKAAQQLEVLGAKPDLPEALPNLADVVAEVLRPYA